MAKRFSIKINAAIILGFLLLLLLPWADEAFDLPSLLMGAPRTLFNWREAIIEMLVIIAISVPVIVVVRRNLYQMEKIRYQLSRNKDQTAAISRQKSKFMGMAAHDLRSPLATMQMALKIIESPDVTPEKMDKYIGIIDSQANNMKNLIDDFLDATKIDIGKMDIEKELLDYKNFVHEVVEVNSLTASKRNISIDLKLDQLPLLHFDPDRIRQVLNNLLSNALKFSPEGSTIKIIVTHPGKFIKTEVIDEGPGIPEEFKSKMFKEFKIGDIKPVTQEPQIGLGLAIAKKIVSLHDGKIGFTSREGKGSTFYFTIPV